MMRIGLEIHVVWLLFCIASLVPVSLNDNYTMYYELWYFEYDDIRYYIYAKTSKITSNITMFLGITRIKR